MEKYPTTQAIRMLRAAGVTFTSHLYSYVEHGGTRESSEQLSVDEHAVVKTIVLENEKKMPLIVLMHGDREISTKNLARFLGVKEVHPCDPKIVTKHTNYMVGGTSPFGTKEKLPVYIEKTILDLERVYINGGKRGFLVGLSPVDILKLLSPIAVEVAV